MRRGVVAPRSAAAALFLILALAVDGASAHKFYASLAQVERTIGGRVEVGLRLFPDDLEFALSASADRKIRIEDTPGFREALMRYLDTSFVLENRDDRAHFRYVGIDAKVNLVWVFVEANWPRPLKGSRLTNRLLLEVSGDQVNTVNLTEGEERETLAFTAARTRLEIFAAEAP